MNRIHTLMATRGKRKLLIPFFTVGYPQMAQSRALVTTAADSGADIIELGIPFSDPLADGPAIQLSSQVALKNGVNLESVLETVTWVRKRSEVPLVLMGYYNPILTFGVSRFLKACAEVGVDGLIIPDLPVEEAHEYCTQIKNNDLSSVFLVAPTSAPERIALIDRFSSDFVYAVTVTGVTGVRRRFDSSTKAYLTRLRRSLKHPFVAGFGVSSPETARSLASHCDGVVIGSALVNMIQAAASSDRARKEVARFLGTVRRGLDKP
jgi:tryptophan synthase alpha chain